MFCLINYFISIYNIYLITFLTVCWVFLLLFFFISRSGFTCCLFLLDFLFLFQFCWFFCLLIGCGISCNLLIRRQCSRIFLFFSLWCFLVLFCISCFGFGKRKLFQIRMLNGKIYGLRFYVVQYINDYIFVCVCSCSIILLLFSLSHFLSGYLNSDYVFVSFIFAGIWLRLVCFVFLLKYCFFCMVAWFCLCNKICIKI